MGICKQCGKEFSDRLRGHDSNMFCSRACSFQYMREHHVYRGVENYQKKPKEKAAKVHRFYICKCAHCGKEFLSKSRMALYCSYTCRYKVADKIISAKKMAEFEPEQRTCAWCGKSYTTDYKHRSIYCSDKCLNASLHSNRKKRLKGKIVDRDISLQKVDKIFNHRCALCGEEVNWNDYSIDQDGNFIAGPSYPSMDHIVPLSQGGMHEWNNIQLAHFKCNAVKGDKILPNFARKTPQITPTGWGKKLRIFKI